jgi:hypothetical protein
MTVCDVRPVVPVSDRPLGLNSEEAGDVTANGGRCLRCGHPPYAHTGGKCSGGSCPCTASPAEVEAAASGR